MSKETQSQVNIWGNKNVVGDSNVLNFYESEKDKTSFFQPSLDRYKPPRYISPPFTHAAIEKLNDQQLLIVGGHPTINKGGLARHFAWRLFDQKSGGEDGDEWPIKEWFEDNNSQSLDIALRDISEPTIFILPQLLPQHINYNPFHLKEIADDGQHLIVASSDVSIDSWKMTDDEKSLFWLNVQLKDFSDEYLTSVLKQSLSNAHSKLPDLFSNRKWEKRQDLVEGLLLLNIARALKTPDNISLFVDLLCGEKHPDKEVIEEIIDRVREHETALRQWYYLLKPREQLLTVALSFFDGMLDDQFFACLDTLVEGTWRNRDPLLASFDYYDLEYLQSVFNFVEAEAGGIKIENRSPEQRQKLLEMAWNSHRRYILSSLESMALIVQRSVNNRVSNMELYGSELKQQQVRAVIGQTISDLGLISLPAVEGTLLRLAADDHPRIQSVAAEAMARWRLANKDEELFTVLDRWRRDTQIVEIVNLIWGDEKAKSNKAPVYIRATVALSVAFAAAYDRPNELSERLQTLFEELSEDGNSLVRHRFATYTLPLVIEQHWEQLERSIKEMVLKADLISSIASSLARAYRFSPNGIVQFLDKWYKESKDLPIQKSTSRPRWREASLRTIALTYGYIPYDPRIGPLTSEEGFKKLESILANEREHPFVRIAVVKAISIKAKERFDEIEPHLRKLVKSLHPDERSQIVDIIVDVYLRQREDQDGGEEILHINKRNYPMWISERRPLTEVEEGIYKWLSQTDNPSAQQIALQSFINFAAKLDQQEMEEIERIKKAKKATTESKNGEEDEEEKSSGPVKTIPSKSNTNLGFEASIATSLFTQGEQNRKIIRGLLPEALNQSSKNSDLFRFVLDNWQKQSTNNQISNIAKILGRIVSIINSKLIVIGALLITVICGCAACSAFG